MACTSDSQKLIIGQVATDENIPTLSIIDIESGKTLRIIEESDNYENSIWKLVIDKNDMNIVYLKQIHNRFYIITYNMKTEEKKLLMETENSEKYEGFIIGPENEFVIGIDNVINFIDLSSNTLTKSIRL